MLRIAASAVRRFSSVTPYFPEHYQYPGNPTQKEFLQEMIEERRPLPQDTTVFVPREQIEFNRIGELLLYEAEPFRIKDIFFPYPQCMGVFSMFWMFYLYITNPFQWGWQLTYPILVAGSTAWYPMVEYLFSLRYYLSKVWLLRGGKVLKLEHSNITGIRWRTWVFIDELNLLTPGFKELETEKGLNAQLLNDNGQLQCETHVQVDNFIDVGRNMENQVLKMCKEGTVHQPEILDAVLKAFEVDTSDFRVNTLHIERWHEPDTNF